MKKRYYIVYKITNTISERFYVGDHITHDLNDGYMGSGTYLKRAYAKYGIDNFKKEILFHFDNSIDMYLKEAEIVTEEFLINEKTYNLKVGGFGGFGYINSNPEKFLTPLRLNSLMCVSERLSRWKTKFQTDPMFREAMRTNAKKAHQASMRNNPNGTFYGKCHSEESKRKIGSANSVHQTGAGNSNFGLKWISNPDLEISKTVEKHEDLEHGWYLGRNLKWKLCKLCNTKFLNKDAVCCSRTCANNLISMSVKSRTANGEQKYKNGYTVSVDGVEYVSISKAADALGIGHETARMRFKSKNFPNYQIIDNKTN